MENVAGWAYLNVRFIDAKDEINIIPAALKENCWPSYRPHCIEGGLGVHPKVKNAINHNRNGDLMILGL